jgi:hypothetical protein
MNEMYLRRKEAMLHPVYKKNITSPPFWLDTAPLGTNASTYHPPGEFESCVFFSNGNSIPREKRKVIY